jgi:hypothetical protein
MALTCDLPFTSTASSREAANLGIATAANIPKTTITKISSIIVKAGVNPAFVLKVFFK